MKRARRLGLVGLALLLGATGCDGAGDGPSVEMTVPNGATFVAVVDSLQARGLVGWPTLFRTYARARGDDRNVRSGRYEFQVGDGWRTILDDLVAGRVLTEPVTIPEGFTLRQMAPRLAEITKRDTASLLEEISNRSLHERWNVPGPGLEGYLFPDTYRFASGARLEEVLNAMVGRYRDYWTPERRALLASSGMNEREIVTIASIIQAEARHTPEMPLISAVYHNRIQRGWPLEADPTVLYALGGPRERLLYAAIDSVADNPYNTYRQPGIPPGPIGAPGARALDAALTPADAPFMFFVARPDGTHVFTRTLAEHNRAKAAARRERDQIARSRGDGPGT